MNDTHRTLLTSWRCWTFASVTFVGLEVACVLSAGSLWMYAVSLVLAVLCGSAIEIAVRQREGHIVDGTIEHAVALGRDRWYFTLYQQMTGHLRALAEHPDPLFRELALERSRELAAALETAATGRLVFHGTETWRIVYERLLRSPGIHLYRSVSWARTPNYWQDEPGRQSLRVNFELQDKGTLNIERIVILPDELWTGDDQLPVERLRQWIHEQSVHGIWVKLVRESAISNEPDLLRDFGIYGTRAVGEQQLDPEARTVTFTLTFGQDAVDRAESQWRRLSIYSMSYRDLLNYFPTEPEHKRSA